RKSRSSGRSDEALNRAHVYEVRPRSDKRCIDLISDVLPFGWLRYGESDAVGKCNRVQKPSCAFGRAEQIGALKFHFPYSILRRILPTIERSLFLLGFL